MSRERESPTPQLSVELAVEIARIKSRRFILAVFLQGITTPQVLEQLSGIEGLTAAEALSAFAVRTQKEISQLDEQYQALTAGSLQSLAKTAHDYPVTTPIFEKARALAQEISGEIVLPMTEPQALPSGPIHLAGGDRVEAITSQKSEKPDAAVPSPELSYPEATPILADDPLKKVWDRLSRTEQVTCNILRKAGEGGISSDGLQEKLRDAGCRTDFKIIIYDLRRRLRDMKLSLILENSIPRGGRKRAHYCFKDLPPEPPSPQPARLPSSPPAKPGGGYAVEPQGGEGSALAEREEVRAPVERQGISMAMLAQKVNRGQNAYACLEKMQKEIPWNDPMKTVVDALIERFQNTALIKQSPYAMDGNIDENHSAVEVLIDEIYQAQRSLDEIVVQNMTLAKYIALKKYPLLRDQMSAAMDFEDLVSIGYEALIEPAARYDPAKGEFSKYVCRRIPGSMIDEIRHMSLVPRSVIKRVDEINDASDTFRQQKGRDPTVNEIGQQTGLSVEQVYEALRAVIQGTHVLSLSGTAHKGDADEGDSDDADTLGDTIADTPEYEPEREVARQEELRWLDEAVHALTKREQVLLSLYYDRNLTLREIGHILGVSEARVWQLHKRAVQTLRRGAQEFALLPA